MDLSWDIVGQLTWTGLTTSTYYVLFAVAFALVLKVNRVWNFGQAGIMVVAYFAIYVMLNRLGLPLAAGLAGGVILTVAIALALEWYGFRVLRDRNASVLTYFIFTLAFAQFAIYSGELVFGADPKTLFASILWPIFLVGPIAVSHWDLLALGVTAALLAGLAAFLRFTKDGQFLFAVADNPELAQTYGINLARAYAISMMIGAILVVGGMYLIGTRAPMYPASPLNQFLILAVVATILAGIGNIFAAGIAAIALNLLQSFSILVISSTWQILLVYSLIFVTILLFPEGVVFSGRKRGVTRKSAAEALEAVAIATPSSTKGSKGP
jgi:branched-subunit amino acid ABC-type transport system permease component